jgi:hypothetical protein
MTVVWLLQVVSTLTMVGVIWFVQVVHYPLMAQVGHEGFPGYATAHARRTAWVVAPPMLIEAATALVLAIRPPEFLETWQAWAGLALLLVVWSSTALLQVPRHRRLAGGFEPGVHRTLVATNWIRTLAWTARGVLLLQVMAR